MSIILMDVNYLASKQIETKTNIFKCIFLNMFLQGLSA